MSAVSVRDVKIHTTTRIPVGLLLEVEAIMTETGLSKNAVIENLLTRGIEAYVAESLAKEYDDE